MENEEIRWGIIGASCDKYHFCCDKIMFVATNTTKLFVETKICRVKHDKIMFVETTICRDKNMFVATSSLLSRQKTCFVFVATTKKLSREKLYLWQLPPVIVGCLVKMETGGEKGMLGKDGNRRGEGNAW